MALAFFPGRRFGTVGAATRGSASGAAEEVELAEATLEGAVETRRGAGVKVTSAWWSATQDSPPS